MFRATRTLLQATQASHAAAAAPLRRTKISTGIVGLSVHPSPFSALRSTYTSTLSILGGMPPAAVYRQAAEGITRERLSAVDQLEGNADETAIAALEARIGQGQIEEVIQIAEDELSLAGKMLEWKA